MTTAEPKPSARTKRRRRGLFRDERGTASLEAALMLPVMAACWLGVLYRASTLDATIAAGVEARRTAWASSNVGCRGESLSCAGSEDDDGFSSGGWLDGLSEVPIVGFLFGSILGYATTVHATRTVDRPPIFGGGEQELRYPYYVMCNEQKMDVDDVLFAAVCEQLPGVARELLGDRCPPPRYGSISCD